jgi:hypothetical protein
MLSCETTAPLASRVTIAWNSAGVSHSSAKVAVAVVPPMNRIPATRAAAT